MTIASFGGNATDSPMNNEDLDNRINQETRNLIESILRSIDESKLTDFDSLITEMGRNGFQNFLAGLNLDPRLERAFRARIWESRKIQGFVEDNIERDQYDRILQRVEQNLSHLPRDRQEAIAREELNQIIKGQRAINKGLIITDPEQLGGIRTRTPSRFRSPRDEIREVRGIVRQKSAKGTQYTRTKPLPFTNNETRFIKNNVTDMTVDEIWRMHQQLFETPRTRSSIRNKVGRLRREARQT